MYRDDGFILFNGSPDEIKEFFDIGNSCHQYLRFTYETSGHSQFLGHYRVQSTGFPDSQRLNIRSYIKPTNSFQYLHRQSAHSTSVFKDWIRGECIRHMRNTSGQDALKTILTESQNPPGKKRIWTLRNWTCHARKLLQLSGRIFSRSLRIKSGESYGHLI